MNTILAQTTRMAAVAVLLGAFFAALPAMASAQLINPVDVHIPFAFTVGSKQLPAGDYTVSRRTSNVLLIQSKDGSEAAMVTTTPIEAGSESGRTAIVFNRYGDDYFLSHVQPSSGENSYRVPQSDEEERLAETARRDRVVVHAGRSGR